MIVLILDLGSRVGAGASKRDREKERANIAFVCVHKNGGQLLTGEEGGGDEVSRATITTTRRVGRPPPTLERGAAAPGDL